MLVQTLMVMFPPSPFWNSYLFQIKHIILSISMPSNEVADPRTDYCVTSLPRPIEVICVYF